MKIDTITVEIRLFLAALLWFKVGQNPIHSRVWLYKSNPAQESSVFAGRHQFLECGLDIIFHFLECGLLWSVVRVSCGFFCFLFLFSFSVTLPGTNAPHSAVTRGKPSLFLVLFSRFQGSLSPPIVLFWYFI